MERFYQTFREYPALAGMGAFVGISVILLIVFGTLMIQSGASLKPLIFFFGFLAIVGVPQGVVHLLDALAHRRAVGALAPTDGRAPAKIDATSARESSRRPVPWETVFGPQADPALRTDARRGLEAILSAATEARLSFDKDGGSALAARFPTVAEAEAALNRYGTFFQFAEVSGSEADGWTGKRFAGQGEWNHVIAASNELYAWTGPSKAAVEAQRVRALGPLADHPTDLAAPGTPAPAPEAPSRTAVSNRLSRNTPVMCAFLGINLVLASGWFFKASAWAARQRPAAGVPAVDLATLGNRLRTLNQSEVPMDVRVGPDDRTWEITWRYGDARWIDWMRVHRVRRTHKLVLQLDEAHRVARVREYWSAFDASGGADGMRLDWRAASGIQFFQLDRQRVYGVQMDAEGRPTGALSATTSFNLQTLRAPIINAVTGGGWVWQPVVWSAPEALRWLTE